MENLLFLGVPILKHIRVSTYDKGEKMQQYIINAQCTAWMCILSIINKNSSLKNCSNFSEHLGFSVPSIPLITLESTVQILCIGTDRSQQTVQTKIRLLLKKQSDQGLRCLPFHQHLLDALMQCYIKVFYF